LPFFVHCILIPAGRQFGHMTNYGRTAPAEERDEILGLESIEKADRAYEKQLRVSSTLAELKTNVRAEMRESLDGDEDAVERMKDIEAGVNLTIQAGAGDIKISPELEKENRGVMGVNEGLSTDTKISTVPLSAEKMAEDPTQAQIVAAHERDEEIGHAGQEEVAGLVDTDGETVDRTMILEGDVEAGTAAKYGEREGMPEDTYREGLDFTRKVGEADVHAYTHGEIGRAEMQAKVFEKGAMTTLEQLEAMQQNGFTDEEMATVLQRTRGQQANAATSMAA
jgi:hypothetical protein